ncbi:hypothetical protein [Abyssalbus ytuae]|uniref:IPT/TIG domain-containing protein n=1 Tax=Abyssalbus ytuae TaxID=2926907 RepID=A0A9E7D1H1_9FLAO|nr:hypothetical protein [Abyssalbus ytuae]UOB17093.1 hypothetical protein MQE35_15300 [Abyssalbus ytuae]
MKTLTNSFINSLKFTSLTMTIILVLASGCSNDAETSLTDDSAQSKNLSVVTPTPVAGGLVQISGDVGNKSDNVQVLVNEEKAEIISFNANKNMTFKLPEDCKSGNLAVTINNEKISLGYLDIIQNLILPIYWVETLMGGSKITKGTRSFSGTVMKETVVTSDNYIVSVANSFLTGQLYYAESVIDTVTFQTSSKIVKLDFSSGNADTILETPGNINAIAVSTLTGKLFFAETDSSSFMTSIKQTNLNGNNTTLVVDREIGSFVSELEYNFLRNKLYFVENSNRIVGVSLDDKVASVIYDDTNFRSVGGLSVDILGNDLYVADLGTPLTQSDVILQGNADGTMPLTPLVTQVPDDPLNPVYNVRAMDYDLIFDYLYWYNSSGSLEPNGSIYRTKVNTVVPELVFDEITLGNSMDVSGKEKNGKSNKENFSLSL